MSITPAKNKKYADLLNDVIRFANSYNASQRTTGVNPANVKLLYFALVNYANTLHWKIPFAVSDKQLELLTSLDHRTLVKAREVLMTAGKIIVATNEIETYYLFSGTEPPANLRIVQPKSLSEIKEGGFKESLGYYLTRGGEVRCKSNILDCSESASNLQRICSESASNLQRICSESASNLQPICKNATLAPSAEGALSPPLKPKTDLAFSPPTTTPTTIPTPTPTSINGNFDEKLTKIEQNSQSETGLIDGLNDFKNKKREEILGAGNRLPPQPPNQPNVNTQSATENSTTTTETGSQYMELVKEFGQDTVAIATANIKRQVERTGDDHILYNYNYLRKTCQTILGMKAPASQTEKPQHEKRLPTSQQDPPQTVMYDKVIVALCDDYLDLIHRRFKIASAKFDEVYTEEKTPQQIVDEILPTLQYYADRGWDDSDYIQQKKARGNK